MLLSLDWWYHILRPGLLDRCCGVANTCMCIQQFLSADDTHQSHGVPLPHDALPAALEPVCCAPRCDLCWHGMALAP
uniref:Uncharacterized protein n=1 Tax=Aegilops tauschii subsp. strangulata TaxID=200361 RepID=A0A453Q664_AEGTS